MKTEEVQADIVVIGAGGSGLVAAVAAAEKGARDIIVLEERDTPGGNSVYAITMFNLGIPDKKKKSTEAQRDEIFMTAMESSHWKTDARVARALIDKSEDIISWLKKRGVNFEIPPFIPTDKPWPFLIDRVGGEMIGKSAVDTMIKKCQSLGVRIFYHTKAKKLLTDKECKIFGVLAEAKNKKIRINTKSIIIATGGFVGNKALLKKFLPPYNEDDDIFIGGLRHKGDGLLMASEVGAATNIIASPEMSVNRMPWSSCLFIIVKHPKTVWVNRNGERFTNESAHDAFNSQYMQTNKTAYTIIDEKIKERIYGEELTPIDKFILASNITLDVIDEKIRQSIQEEDLFVGNRPWNTIAEKDLLRQASQGRIKTADSWDEIAQWMGANHKVLKATIDQYNDSCDNGHDDIFAKNQKHLLPLRTPPYYAIRCYLNLMVTHGGIKVNHRMEVIDNQDKPITGLYAAGADAGGVDFDTYCSIPGHGFGFAINSGRIAGENAAIFLNSK